ncbi:hypothetical protein [Alistipes sp.]
MKSLLYIEQAFSNETRDMRPAHPYRQSPDPFEKGWAHLNREFLSAKFED